MMKARTVPALVACLIAMPAVAQNKGNNNKGVNNVAGRTYCSVVNILSTTSVPATDPITGQPTAVSSVLTSVGRSIVTFNTGNYVRTAISAAANIRIGSAAPAANNQLINIYNGDPADPVINFYAQSGSKLDVDIDAPNDFSATWYVSGDGTVIHGTALRYLPPDPADPTATTTVGQRWNWTLVEGSDCNTEKGFE